MPFSRMGYAGINFRTAQRPAHAVRAHPFTRKRRVGSAPFSRTLYFAKSDSLSSVPTDDHIDICRRRLSLTRCREGLATAVRNVTLTIPCARPSGVRPPPAAFTTSRGL
jgi:hypothetical protein